MNHLIQKINFEEIQNTFQNQFSVHLGMKFLDQLIIWIITIFEVR